MVLVSPGSVNDLISKFLKSSFFLSINSISESSSTFFNEISKKFHNKYKMENYII